MPDAHEIEALMDEEIYTIRADKLKSYHAMVAVGDSGSCIQLLAPLSETSTIAKFLERSGPGIQQMAFRVTDVEAVAAVLRSRGVRLLYDAAKRGTSDSRVNFIHPKDAGGVLVELVEPGTTDH